MTSEPHGQDVLFEVLTPLGFVVRVTHAYWRLIVTIKHPVMLGQEAEVNQALAQPEEIRQSRSDPDVYLFYRTTSVGRWVCAVAKRVGGVGFLITAYPTDAIKEGLRLWPR
jgi:hypothetical protein